MSRSKTLLAALISLLFLSGVIAPKVRAGEELLPGPSPTAVAPADPVAVTPGTEVSLDGSHSYDKDIKVTWEERNGKKYNYRREEIEGVVKSWSWDFGDGTSGNGATTSHAYSEPGEYTVTLIITADHDETAANTVTVLVGAELSYIEAVDDNDDTRKSQTKLQMVSSRVLQTRSTTITAYQDVGKWLPHEPVWSGVISASGVDSVNITTRSGGAATAEAGGVSKTVEIEIVNGIKHEISIGTSAFGKFQDILTGIATKLQGKKDKVTAKVSGNYIWYQIDQTNSPLCQTTHKFSAEGKLGYSDKFYIPALSINFRYVKVGIFVEPEIYLTITGIEIVQDGTKNPVQFTEVNGGAGLKGSISGGAGVEINDPWEVLSAEADLKGTAKAGGAFVVSIPGPKLSGTYTIGEITVSGMVKIEYRDHTFIEKRVSKPVWEGIKGTATVDLSSYFSRN